MKYFKEYIPLGFFELLTVKTGPIELGHNRQSPAYLGGAAHQLRLV
jgi:hypothetical protein